MAEHSEDISGYLGSTTDFEGVSSDFTDVVPLPSPGYCDLYKAKRYSRWYLLKCLKQNLTSDPAYHEMLRKEFSIMMRLQHSGVLQASSMETVSIPGRGKAVCIVAEWIDGRTLGEYLAEKPPLSERRRLADEMTDALAYIHSQQVVHRDLKPSNIMVTHNGNYAKIIDFGLADTDSHAILKQPAGTLRYMAPEQMQATVADVRNDIYSLGMVMQEMNLGRGNYQRVAERCLRPIEQRYQNMDALLADLRNRTKQRLLWAAMLLLVAGIIAALVFQIDRLRQQALSQAQHTAVLNRQLRVLNHEILDFADPEAERLCLLHWDTNGDGELTFEEAAAVTELGNVFTQNKMLRSFEELEHFTGLTDISAEAFMGCSNLRSLKIPGTVRFFRHNAFRQSGLESFSFPGTVAGIGDHILDDCPQLETIIFEAKLPQSNVGSRHVNNCPKLSTIFADNAMVEQINDGTRLLASGFQPGDEKLQPEETEHIILSQAWSHVVPLMTDHIPFADPEVKTVCIRRWDRDGNKELSIDEAMAVNTIGKAFCGNTRITHFDELKFFTGIQTIETSAFEGCDHLQSVRLPSTIRLIDSYAFYACRSLTAIQLPDDLEQVNRDAFMHCDLRELFIPAKTTSIATRAFICNENLSRVEVSTANPVYDSREDCNAIIETATNMMVTGSPVAIIPRSVTRLSDEAFVGFHREDITLPIQMTHIGRWTFSCSIPKIYCEAPTPPFYEGEAILFLKDLQGNPVVIYVPFGAREAYCQANGWRDYASTIRECPIAVPFSVLYEIAKIIHQMDFQNTSR